MSLTVGPFTHHFQAWTDATWYMRRAGWNLKPPLWILTHTFLSGVWAWVPRNVCKEEKLLILQTAGHGLGVKKVWKLHAATTQIDTDWSIRNISLLTQMSSGQGRRVIFQVTFCCQNDVLPTLSKSSFALNQTKHGLLLLHAKGGFPKRGCF